MSRVQVQVIVESRGPAMGEGKGPQENLTPREAEAKVRALLTAEAMGKGGRPDLVRPVHQNMLRPKQKGGQPDMLRPKQ
eukprot:4818997-Alexandrium_andersonii.AAC.1